MTCYPLLFARRELVEGNGFVARVAVSGRALLTDEEGEVWVEGINPGGSLRMEKVTARHSQSSVQRFERSC
jgi:hypothetical protein